MSSLPQPIFLAAPVLALFCSMVESRAEWPQFRGPERDGIARSSPPLQTELPASGLAEVWEFPLGTGFAGPVVAGGKTFIFHRVDNTATLDCLDAKTGEPIWAYRYETNYRDDFGFDPGPRSAPTVASDTALCYGPEGFLTAVDINAGTLRWQLDLAATYGAPKGFFGRAGAPMVSGQNVIINIGASADGEPAGVVAINIRSGRESWRSSSHEASYSSPVLTSIEGEQTAVFLTRDGLLGLAPDTGRLRFETPYRPSINASVNAASPVMTSPDTVFISTCYGVGGSVWKLFLTGPPRPVWQKEGVLDAHYSTPVFAGGHLYGFHGRQESGTELRCINPATAEVVWETDELPCGQLISAAGNLIVLTEDGELALLDATPRAYRPHWRTQVFRRGVRCVPAFAGGLLYARGPKRLVCVDLRKNPN